MLANVLPEAPTYLFLVPELSTDDLTLAGVPPLANLLLQLGHIDLTPKELDLRVALNSWGASSSIPLAGDSRALKHQLRLQSAASGQSGIVFLFDYSSLPDKADAPATIRLQTRFDQSLPAPVSAFSLRFQSAAAASGSRHARLDPFGLLVISAANPPPPLAADLRVLQADHPTLESTLGTPLWQRLQTFHIGSLSWRLHPYVVTANSSGGQILVDLDNALPPDVQPSLGAGLDFAAARGFLARKRLDQREECDRLKQKIQSAGAIILPTIDWNLPVGAVLSVTNESLLSFKSYLPAQSQEKPSSRLFLDYLTRLTDAAKPQQPWLKDWVEVPSEPPHQRMLRLYNLCVQNLPADVVASLAVTNENHPNNYFVAELDRLQWTEAIEKWTKDKQAADSAVERTQELLDLIPEYLEQVAYVRLFLGDASQQVEVIRFAGPRQR